MLVKANEGTFTPVTPGMHLARCYRIVDLGTQKSTYMGTEKHLKKVMFQFEVHSEDESGHPLVTSKGDPLSISKNFTQTLAEKSTLRKDLQTWRGREFTREELRGFQLKNVLGVWAMISVITSTGQDGKEYTNIAAIMPVPKRIKEAGLPEGKNALAMFSIDDPDMEIFNTFSDNLKAKIQNSPEWKERNYATGEMESAKSTGSGFDDMEDDIPF